MRSLTLYRLTLLCLFLPVWHAAAAPPPPRSSLVLISASEAQGPELAAQGYFLCSALPDGYLAFADASALARLRAAGVEARILAGEDEGDREYLVVFPLGHGPSGPGDAPRSLPAAVQVLHEGAGYRVLALPAALLASDPDLVRDARRVWRRPLRFAHRPWTEPGARESTDPSIQAMVAAVQEGNLVSEVQLLENFGTRHSQETGGYLASLWIRDQFLAQGYTQVEFHDYNEWNDNVVCVKPGSTHPEEVVVLGGHYDSTSWDDTFAPGADDNASGTTGVIEAARVMAGTEFERSLIFIAFSGEEEGLVGSEAWAAEAVAADMDIVGMINLDMICYRAGDDGEDLDIISNEASQPLRDLAFDAIATYVPELSLVDGHLVGAGSDHMSFWDHGYQALFYFEDSDQYSPYLHSPDDVVGLSANHFDFMLKNVRAAVAATAVLARPFHVGIEHEPLSHSESGGPFAVLASIRAIEDLDPGSLFVYHRSNGSPFVATALLPTGNPDEYEATIPVRPPATQVEYYLTAADALGNGATSPAGAPGILHRFWTGIQFVFAEDGEADQGWTLGLPGDDAETGLWIRADPVGTSYQPEDDHSPDPGTLCFVTGNAAPGEPSSANDVDGGRTTLLSPLFPLGDAAWAGLSYWRWYADETNRDDEFRVDLSNDGGDSWSPLEVLSASAYPWVEVRIDDLGALLPLTDQMRLRFVAEDRGLASIVEALVDDLALVAVYAEGTAAEAPAAPRAGLVAYPNPFNPRTTFRFTLPRSGLAELRIFDSAGAERARLLSARREAGTHSLDWEPGGLASGLYLARLSLDGEALATRKLSLLK